jgi:acetyltransferase
MKRRGLGWLLMQLMLEYARSEGLRTIQGQVLRENKPMLEMCQEFGFRIASDPQEPSSVTVTLPLSA